MTIPFVNWAGGKRKIVKTLQQYYPEKFRKYVEPFLGSGAVLLDILQNYPIEEAYANDLNKELVKAHIDIRDNVEKVIDELRELEILYETLPPEQWKSFYYKKRSEFNLMKSKGGVNSALFIFLNKTCFNGMYRVNKAGEFNSAAGLPFKGTPIFTEDNLRECSRLFSNVDFSWGDYTQCWDVIDSNTFVFLDPPYRPLSDTARFTYYTPEGFNDEDQLALFEFCRRMDKEKGAKFLLTNSENQDNFLENLYASYSIHHVEVRRSIGGTKKAINHAKELIITN